MISFDNYEKNENTKSKHKMSSSNSVRAQKRLQKELQSIVKDPIPGVRLDSTQIETNMFQ